VHPARRSIVGEIFVGSDVPISLSIETCERDAPLASSRKSSWIFRGQVEIGAEKSAAKLRALSLTVKPHRKSSR